MMFNVPLRCLIVGLNGLDLFFRGGWRLSCLKSRLYLQSGHPPRALESALEGLDRSPECAELHYRAGRAAIAMVRYAYARTRMAYAVALEPEHYAYRFGLAYTAQRCGELEIAQREYESILSVRSEDFNVRLNLSLVYKSLGMFSHALEGFEDVARQRPKEQKALYGAAVCAHRLKDVRTAHFWAEKCVLANRKHHKAHLLLGVLAEQSGYRSRAIGHFNDARQLNPDNGRALAALGRLHIEDDPARGRHFLREALLVPDPDTTAHFELAQYYERRRQLREARAEYALYIRYHSGQRAEWAKTRRIRLHQKISATEVDET